jgi:hypothetical protein
MAWFCTVGSALEDTLVLGTRMHPKFVGEQSIEVGQIKRRPGGMALNVASHLAHLDSKERPQWTSRRLLAKFAMSDSFLDGHLRNLNIQPVDSVRSGCKATGRCVSIAFQPVDTDDEDVRAKDRCFFVAAASNGLARSDLSELESIVEDGKGLGYGHIHIANIGGEDAYLDPEFVNMLVRLKGLVKNRKNGDRLVITGSTVSREEGLKALRLAKLQPSRPSDTDHLESVGRTLVQALDWVIMSNSEACVVMEQCGKQLVQHAELDDIAAAAKFLYGEIAARSIALTCGENGAAIVDGSLPNPDPEKISPVEAAKVKLVDPTGAGDAWTASFINELASGSKASLAARRANVYAAASLSVIGGSDSAIQRNDVKAR